MQTPLQPLPPSNARRSPLVTALSPVQLRKAPDPRAAILAADTVPRRAEDWPARLREYLEAHATRPFDWATWNCCHFAADWVLAVCAVDLLGPYRAQCTGHEAALQILRKKGGVGGFFARACRRHSWPQVHRYYAARGDLVLFKGEGGAYAVGLCCGEALAGVGKAGIEYRDMHEATHAFKIG